MKFKKIPKGFKWGAWVVGGIILLKILSSFFRPSESLQVLGAVPVKKGILTVKVTATGNVQPYNRVEVKPPIPGRVDDVLVNEGDAIHKGQVLAWMSSTERAALLDAAKAEGEEVFKRWQEAYKPAPLISPLDGLLIVRSVEPGRTVSVADPVVVISDRLIVEALVDETDLSFIKLGQKTEIRLDAYPEKVFMGKVDHIYYESKLSNNVNVYPIDIVPEQVPENFRSGMTANVTFIVANLENVLLVPSEAVAEWPQKNKKPKEGDFAVYKKVFGGKLVPMPVKIGESDGRMTEIREGLEEGMTIQIVRKKQSEQGATPFSAFGQKKDAKKPS